MSFWRINGIIYGAIFWVYLQNSKKQFSEEIVAEFLKETLEGILKETQKEFLDNPFDGFKWKYFKIS